MYDFLKVLWFLYVAHAITDIVGQSQKTILLRRRGPLNAHWFYWLLAHGLLNGFGVYMITGYVGLGIVETFHHMFTDFCKDEGYITLGADQLSHFIAKLIWAGIVVWL